MTNILKEFPGVKALSMSHFRYCIWYLILKRFKDIKITKVSHEEFKKLTKDSKAVVRTGECSPL